MYCGRQNRKNVSAESWGEHLQVLSSGHDTVIANMISQPAIDTLTGPSQDQVLQ